MEFESKIFLIERTERKFHNALYLYYMIISNYYLWIIYISSKICQLKLTLQFQKHRDCYLIPFPVIIIRPEYNYFA